MYRILGLYGTNLESVEIILVCALRRRCLAADPAFATNPGLAASPAFAAGAALAAGRRHCLATGPAFATGPRLAANPHLKAGQTDLPCSGSSSTVIYTRFCSESTPCNESTPCSMSGRPGFRLHLFLQRYETLLFVLQHLSCHRLRRFSCNSLCGAVCRKVCFEAA